MVFQVSLWVDWDRQPVSVHAAETEILEQLILHLRNRHNVRKRSIVMPDRENDGYLFFIYQDLGCHRHGLVQSFINRDYKRYHPSVRLTLA